MLKWGCGIISTTSIKKLLQFQVEIKYLVWSLTFPIVKKDYQRDAHLYCEYIKTLIAINLFSSQKYNLYQIGTKLHTPLTPFFSSNFNTLH